MDALRSQNPACPPTLTLCPVLGEGLSTQWQKVKDLIRLKVEPHLGSQADLINQLSISNSLRCHVLLNSQEVQGVVIYASHLCKALEKRGYLNCLSLQILYAADQETASEEKPESSFILRQMIQIGQGRGADSLSVRVGAKAEKMLNFYQKSAFEVVEASDASLLLCKRLVSFFNGSKMDDLEPKVEAPKAKKRLRNETEVMTPPEPYLRPQKLHVPPRRLTMRTLTIQRPYFTSIREGRKTVEGRLFSSRLAKVKEGERIVFRCGEDSIVCKVTQLARFISFEEMLLQEGMHKCLPGIGTVAEGVKIYHRFRGYKAKEQEKGVLALHLEHIN